MTIAQDNYPKLIFACPFDANDQIDAENKGFMQYASVQVTSDRKVPVFFYDLVRLQEDLESGVTVEGRPLVAEPGMIVVPAVTLANMNAAVIQLFEEGFFDKFIGVEVA